MPPPAPAPDGPGRGVLGEPPARCPSPRPPAAGAARPGPGATLLLLAAVGGAPAAIAAARTTITVHVATLTGVARAGRVTTVSGRCTPAPSRSPGGRRPPASR